LLIRQAAWHATLLHPFLYAVDLKRALSFGEAQAWSRRQCYYSVLEGLHAQDEVVTDGSFILKAESIPELH
jgi:hypothetical protein